MDIALALPIEIDHARSRDDGNPSGSKLWMGMAMAEPPALLKALVTVPRPVGSKSLKVYYFEATKIAGGTILRYEPE